LLFALACLAALLGPVHGDTSMLEHQIVALRKETAGEKVHPAVWNKLGTALMQLSRQTFDESLYDEAEAAFLKAAATGPKNTEAFLGLAWTRNSLHQFEDGARWAKAALALDPDLPRAYALLGDGAVERGAYDQAFEHYQKALDLKPNLSTYSRAAHLLWLTGDTRTAQWLMQKAIEAGGAYPENAAWCRAELAMMQFHAGALSPAQSLAARALQDAPDNPRILTIAGRLAMAGGDRTKARDLLERAVAIVPQHESLAALVDLARENKQAARAESFTTQLLDFHRATGHPHQHEGNTQLARFLADHDRDLDRALREARRAYRSYPNLYAADCLAWCYFKTGQIEEARRTIRKALAWNTPDASLHFHAGMIYARIGDRERAREHLSRSLKLNPHFHPRDAKMASETLAKFSSG